MNKSFDKKIKMENAFLNKLSLILFFSLTFQSFAIACSCFPYEPVFCRIAHTGHNIVRATVISHPDFNLMEIKIIEDINNEITEDTVMVLGQDGLNCGESLNQFLIQDTLILALRYVTFNGTDYWYLEGFCGLHFLRYKDGMVTGQITDTLTEQPLQDFKDNLFTCLDMQLPTEDILSKKENLNVFPNPVTSTLHIETNLKNILEIDIFNAGGQLIIKKQNEFSEINTNDLNKGIYFIRVKTSKGILTRKFLKT